MSGVWLFELTLAFIVFCSDSVAEDHPRPMGQRLIRSVFWMVTLTRWFTHRNIAKLGRFAGIVWFLVTTGWLLTLEYDRTRTMLLFLVLAEATMAFIVYCVDAMSADLHGRPLRRLVRSVFWMKALTEYLSSEDSIRIVHASLMVWILLTTGWLLSLEYERIAQPLGQLLR